MEATDIYLKCENILNNCKQLFGYYERYRNCVAVSYLDDEMNNVLHKISCSYAMLMTDVEKEARKRGLVNNLAIIKAYNDVETITDHNLVFIDHIFNLLQINKDNILVMLGLASETAIAIYVSNFERALTDARLLINRMEMLIRNSQTINQPYLRATA